MATVAVNKGMPGNFPTQGGKAMKKNIVIPVLFLLMLVLTLISADDMNAAWPVLHTRTDYFVPGGGPNSLANGDFNGDGKIDLTASGSTLSGWSGGDRSGNGKRVVTLNTDTSLATTFDQNLLLIARDTYNFYKVFRANGLPCNSFNVQNESKKTHANPAEIGFYMLSHIIAYEMQQGWSPSLSDIVGELQTTIDQP
jgi:hypothetical protein